MSLMSLHSKINSSTVSDRDQQQRHRHRNHDQSSFDFDDHFYKVKKKPRWANTFDLVVGQGYAIADNIMQDPSYPPHPTKLAGYSAEPFRHIRLIVAGVIIVAFFCLIILHEISSEVTLPPVLSTSNDVAVITSAEPAPVAIALPATGTSTGSISPVFTPEVQRWESLIISYANHFGIDPNVVATVMQIESCGDPYAESGAGAQGLFQVMPFHFESHEDMKDPATNANRGVAYLALGIDITNGDIGRAMAGYNGGHSIALKDSTHWANETQRYYYWGSGIYADAMSGLGSSTRLDEWMQAGGSSLCAQAASREIIVRGY